MYYELIWSLSKTANIIDSSTIHRTLNPGSFPILCSWLMVLISKLDLLYPGQEPVLIEKIFVSKGKTKPLIPPLTCIERKHKSPIVYIEVGEAVWKAGRVAARCIGVYSYMWEGERERESSRLFCCCTADVFLLTGPAAPLLWVSSPIDSFTHKTVCLFPFHIMG